MGKSTISIAMFNTYVKLPVGISLMAGRAKENLPGGSPQYLFVYLKVRIFKCSYRIYLYSTT